MRMNVLVVGGTGFIGTNVVRELVDRGHAVTVLARAAENDLPADTVRVANGDVTEYGSIEGAFAEQEVVVNLVALSPLFTPDGGEGMHERVHADGTENVVEAAEAHDVRKLVQMSALGADPDGPTAYLRAKGAAERTVRDAALDWVLIRPSVIFGDGGEFIDFTKMLTTPYVTGLPGGGTTRFQPLWVGDLAPMLVDAVENDEHDEEVYELGGPDVLTLADVTRLVYQADGTSIRVVPIPMVFVKLGLHVGDKLPGFPMGTDQYRSLQFDNTVRENDVRAFGLETDDLRSLAEYLSNGTDGQQSPNTRSAWTARSTLLLFAFLALTWHLPDVVDIYSYGELPRVLFVPAYLLMLVLYDNLWGLENVVYAIDPIVPGSGRYLWDAGLIVTYYLFAVAVTWLGRRFKPSRHTITPS